MYTLEEVTACVGKGWENLVIVLWKLCESQKVEIIQVKEKYGGLRFYVGDAPGWVLDIIETYEDISEEICENCGRPGQPRGGGWIKTLCDECHMKKEK